MRRTGVVGDPEWTHRSDSHVPRAKLSVSSLQSSSMNAMRASVGVQGEVDRRGLVLPACLAPYWLMPACFPKQLSGFLFRHKSDVFTRDPLVHQTLGK